MTEREADSCFAGLFQRKLLYEIAVDSLAQSARYIGADILTDLYIKGMALSESISSNSLTDSISELARLESNSELPSTRLSQNRVSAYYWSA